MAEGMWAAIYPWAVHGMEANVCQLIISENIAKPSMYIKPSHGVNFVQNDNILEIRGNDFYYEFDLRLGTFTKISRHGTDFITQPVTFDIWRAPTDNDRNVKHAWRNWGLNRAGVHIYESCLNNNTITTRFMMGSHTEAPILKGEAVWSVDHHGRISLKSHINVNERPAMGNKSQLMLPRFGLKFVMPKGMEQVDYFGYGPHENYTDMRLSVYKTLHSTCVNDIFENYAMPQENGARYSTDYAFVGDERARGLLFEAVDKPFSFNAMHYTSHDLDKAQHPHELTKLDETIVNIDYKNNAIGSNSCGPELYKPHRFDEREFTFNISFVPVLM